jgi:hypothetical protein
MSLPTAPVPIIDPGAWFLISTSTVQGATDNTSITVTSGVASAAKKGMVIRFNAGVDIYEYGVISQVLGTKITFSAPLNFIPNVADQFQLVTQHFLKVDSTGRVSIANLPAQYFTAPNFTQGPSGTLTNVNDTVELPSNPDDSTSVIWLYGVHTGVTVSFQISADFSGSYTEWLPYSMEQIDDGNCVTSLTLPTNGAKQLRFAQGSSAVKMRVKLTAISSGSVSVLYTSYAGVKAVTQAVSQRGTWSVAENSGSSSTTATINVVATAGGTTLFSANSSAKQRVISNETGTILYIRFTTAPTSSVYRYILYPKDPPVVTSFTGVIIGLSASGTIAINCSEDT